MLESVRLMMNELRNYVTNKEYEFGCNRAFSRILENFAYSTNKQKMPERLVFVKDYLNACASKLKDSKFAQDEINRNFLCGIGEYFEEYLVEAVKLPRDEYEQAVNTFEILRIHFTYEWHSLQHAIVSKYYDLIDFDGNEQLAGNFCCSSIDNFKKTTVDKVLSKGFISARYTNTDRPSWYRGNNRSVLLAYDFSYDRCKQLIGMSTEDATTYPRFITDRQDGELPEDYVFYKILFDGFIPVGILLGMNPCNFSCIEMPNDLKEDNEIILSAEAEPRAIIITKNYFEDFESTDSKGVKAYSFYADLPIYRLEDGSLKLVSL